MGSSSRTRIPVRVSRVLEVCRKGGTLVRSYRSRPSLPAETVYHFEPSGRSAPPKAVETAIAAGLLVPIGDGLLPGHSQSFELARGR